MIHKKRYSQNNNRRDLSGTKYIGSDIRGVDFSNCDLVGADFTAAHAGQCLKWRVLVILELFSLLIISSLMIGSGSAFFASVITSMNSEVVEKYQINTFTTYGIPSLIIVASLTWMFTSKKYNSGVLGGVLVFIVAMIVLTLLSKTSVDIWLFNIVVIFIATTAVFSGAIIGSLIIAAWAILFTKNQDLFLIFPFLCVSIIGAYLSIYFAEPGMVEELKILGVIVCVGVISNMLWLSFYIGRKAAFLTDGRYISINQFSHAIASTGGTNFKNADLTESNFSNATLKSTDFRGAKLRRTCWYNAKQLECSRLENTYLEVPVIRSLVVSKEAVGVNFDHLNMSGLDLEGAILSECSFISSDLSETNLHNTDLSRAKLVKSQLYASDLSGSCLTGAFIQDWAISTDTDFDNIQCDYIYMRLPTESNPDAWRKPDNRNETFKENDFSDFIAPIVKTLDFYRQPNIDPRHITDPFKTLDLYHHHGIDPSAASIALKQVAKNHPDTILKIVALEGRGNEKIRLQAVVSGDASQSDLSEEYFRQYKQVSALPYNDIQKLLASIAEKDDRIKSLEEMVKTAIQGQKFYIETQYSMGAIDTEKLASNRDNDRKSPMKTILLLSANPIGTESLRLDKEVRELQKGLERSKKRDNFRIVQRWAVTPMDVRRALLDVKPHIVHFSGHGVGSATKVSDQSRSLAFESNKVENNEGLVLEDESGYQKLVPSHVLAELFCLFSENIECILLNSCFSEVQANAIVEHISHVIGMKEAIGDEAAIKFSVGFYDALLAGNTIELSFKVGCNAIQLAGISGHLTPTLLLRG